MDQVLNTAKTGIELKPSSAWGTTIALAIIVGLGLLWFAYGADNRSTNLEVWKSEDNGTKQFFLDETEVRAQQSALAVAFDEAREGKVVNLRGRSAGRTVGYLNDKFGSGWEGGDARIIWRGEPYVVGRLLG